MRNFVVALSIFCAVLFCTQARALDVTDDSPVYLPLANLAWNPALLESSLNLGNTGVSLLGHSGTGRSGGSFTAMKASFPFERTEESRISGWGAGIGAGYVHSINVHEGNKTLFFAPASYFWEVAFGRGTTEPLTGRESGLRGYFEVAFRDQRPQHSPVMGEIFSINLVALEEHNNHVALRMGAANDASGKGLVDQVPPRWTYRFQGTIYLPVLQTGTARVFLDAQGNAFVPCLTDDLKCGFLLNFLQSSNGESRGLTQELYRHAAAGPALEWHPQDRFFMRFQAPWSWIVSRHRTKKLVGNVMSEKDISGTIFYSTKIFFSTVPALDFEFNMSF